MAFFILLLASGLQLVFYVNVSSEGLGGLPPVFKSRAEYIRVIDSPQRAIWQMPEKVVDHLAIKQGNVVADIGVGPGYFSAMLSKKVGKNGKIYAVDIDRGMIEFLEKRLKKEGINNVETIISKPDDPLLQKSSVDLVFICNTFFLVDNREEYLKILKGILKKNGRVAIVDFQATDIPIGPPRDIKVPKKKAIEEALNAGFKLKSEYNFLPYQYFLVFARN